MPAPSLTSFLILVELYLYYTQAVKSFLPYIYQKLEFSCPLAQSSYRKNLLGLPLPSFMVEA